ncbi:ATP-grasp domain-containing protein [Streptomyces qinglanensis]|uniref:Predicted ATP-dependent carboligase, ATP-grasp superfamily n=1 Tax=Streptomyces qinglanensis TaxID=943816 RepID=A0A1H9TFH7_9ACTN|nr:ATP-grasp domain-containing protein [Streptomyces qinglanensis]SER95797.1 Predicted ATP-dependent carboligase, ATP-grasp superfamily [Streptomyces qinglanensis]
MPSFATDVPALLLRLDPNPYHHGTLGAARSLGRAGVEVHALVGSRIGAVGRTRFLHRVHTPRPAAAAGPGGAPTDAELERALLETSGTIGRPAVLVPLDDRGAIGAARLAPRLAGRYLLPAVAPLLPARLADKAELSAVCARAEVAHPPTVLPGSAHEAARAAAELGLPAVAKWSRPWLLPPGLRSTALVRSPDEAARLYERTAEAGSALLLQRRLPDAPGADWFFHGYAAEGGRFLIGGAGRKERSWPPRTGLTAVGTWLPCPAVEEAAARLAAALDYRGILDLDFRLDPVTGIHHLVDFNPRPGAQFRLFTDGAGLDVVRAQHLHLTGRPVPVPRGGPGRGFVVENYALLSALLGPRARGRARAAPRGPVERAWFAADDPLPFAAMAAGWLGRCLARGAHPAALRERLRTGSARTAPEHAASAARPVTAGPAHPAPGPEGPQHTEPTPHTERRNPCTTS